MNNKKHIKKRIVLISVITLLVLLTVAVAIPVLILWIDDMDRGPHMTIHFADPSLSEDIYADAVYMSYDRAIHYTTTDGYHKTDVIPEEKYAQYNSEVRLLIRLVQAATAGDADAYNACFSPEYIAASGGEEPFTMQKIYDIEIINYHQSGGAVPEPYKEVAVYGLCYKIKDNNGSLRSDMGSNAEHEQYISVVTDITGESYIYGIELHYTR